MSKGFITLRNTKGGKDETLPLNDEAIKIVNKHKLLVSVYFEDRSPVRQAFKVEWSGKWADGEVSMRRELKIKMIR